MDAKEILKEMCRIYDDMEENHSLMWEEHTLMGGTCGEEYELMDYVRTMRFEWCNWDGEVG